MRFRLLAPILLVSSVGLSQQLVVIPARTSTGTTELHYSFYAALRVRIVSSTTIKASEARVFRLRVFSGTKDDLLGRNAYRYDAAAKCFYYHTVLFTPEANPVNSKTIDLDFQRMMDERWVGDPNGQVHVGRYVFVLETARNPSLPGAIEPEIFALKDDEKRFDYFRDGVDVTVDPSGATAQRVISLFARTGGQVPPVTKCATATADPRSLTVLVASIPEAGLGNLLARLFRRRVAPVEVGTIAAVTTLPCTTRPF